MNTPTIKVEALAQFDYGLPDIQKLVTEFSSTNNNHHAIPISEILKEYPHRFDHDLAAKIRVHLGHISLAAELLGSFSKDNDLKMCLDVIKRNSTRINLLVIEFDSFLQIGGEKAEKLYFH